MRRHQIVLIAAVLGITLPALAQHRVDPKNRGERAIVVVPFIGSGTPDNPKRPMLVPLPSEMRRSGIYEYSYQVSDDGRYAIVEFAAQDKSALEAILKDSRAVRAFEKGKHSTAEIERELKRYKQKYLLAPAQPALLPGGPR